MSKKFFIVFGHHNYKPGSSFNACIKDEILLEAKRLGHSVDLINLYEEKPIKFWDGTGPDEQILDYRKRLEACDIFIIMSDCHNYIMRSICENFLANVFTPPWAFTYRKIIGSWGWPQPGAMKNKKIVISLTYGGPHWFYSGILQQIPRRIKKMVFKHLCGARTSYMRFYSILPNMPKNVFEKHMEKVRKTVQQL